MLVTLDVKYDASTGRYAATFGTDRLRVSGIPFNEVQLRGCCDVTMTLRGDRIMAVFTGRLEGDSLTGPLKESTGDGRFAYSRTPAKSSTFEERDVTFANGPVTLPGSLVLPRTGSSLSAVVFLHGSGAEGRWTSRFLAAQLANRGIAALIFDKRGVGASSGDWRRATSKTSLPTVPPRLRDCVASHESTLDASGCMAIARVARSHPLSRRAPPVSRSSSDRPPPDCRPTPRKSSASSTPCTRARRRPTTPRARGRTRVSSSRSRITDGHDRALDSLATALRDRPWFFAPPPPDNAYWSFSPVYARYRPLEWWSRVRVPVLLLYGADDQRVPAAQSAERIAAALRNAGNADVTVRIYPGADHTFRLPPAASGWPVTAPGYISDLLDWLAKR